MFIGHWAPALVAGTHKDSPGLGTLFVAGQLVDFGFMAFVLSGVEHMRIVPGFTAMNSLDLYYMPFTHSLLGTLVWAAAFAAVIFAVTKNRTGAVLGAAVVVSHWLLDLLVHAPDLTLWGQPPKLGFGLWNYPAIEMPLELLLTFGALAFYFAKTRSIAPSSRYAALTLTTLLIIFQLFDWFAPRPEELTAELPISALAAYTAAALAAWWVGRTRTIKRA